MSPPNLEQLLNLELPSDFPVAPNLTLPADADARRLAFVGMSGSGKTSSAKVVVEHMARAGRRVCIIDPAGVKAQVLDARGR